MKYLLILLILISFGAFGADTSFILDFINFECTNSESCEEREARYQNLIGEYRSTVHLKDTLKIMASDGGYESFFYTLKKEGDKHILSIKVKIKPVISEIEIGTVDRNMNADPADLFGLKVGEYFEETDLREAISNLKRRLESLGYPNSSYAYDLKFSGSKVKINIAITLREPRLFKGIKTSAKSTYLNEFLNRKFNVLFGKPFELNKFKVLLDEAQKELFSYGYYLLGLDFSPVIKENRVILDIKVSNEKLFAFDLSTLQEDSRSNLLDHVKDLFRKYKKTLTASSLESSIKDYFVNQAFLNTEVEVTISKYKNKYAETVTLYRVDIDENNKTIMKNVFFTGNNYFTTAQLDKMFEKEAFELASAEYYDQDYLNYFVGFLKSKYIKDGFVQAKIIGPNLFFNEGKGKVDVQYNIQEGQRARIRSVKIQGIDESEEQSVIKRLSNTTGKPFNPFDMAEDIKKVAAILQDRGYYFAEVLNANDDNLVHYSANGVEVDIGYNVKLGPLIKLNRIIYLGNNKTKKKILAKKILLKKSDIITPAKTRAIESSLSATGLFNTVSVVPVRHSSKNATTDLVVRVTEREYGLVEFAPGYRTDLGLKLTGSVSYLNIGGMNRAITLRSQVNKRLTYQTLDERRSNERRQLIEHNTSFIYTQGDIYDTLIDSSTTLSVQRRRFYAFDADIVRLSQTLTRDFTRRFSSSLRYQYEDIEQFDASQPIDEGKFRIGSITPSITYDNRNSQTLPVRGAFYNLSCEFANPYFLSQEETDLTVNYYKLVSRNRFYIPFKNGTVAISMVAGVEENLEKRALEGQPGQTRGYIPNIKVFRLTGMDIVRGYDDEEINRLSDDTDLSKVRVQNSAFLANFKLEPRYFINDSLMAGVFFDAGRVYVDRVDLGDLRTSAGITLKILTPVGTLDFDYGIKLLRKEYSNGKLEDPGRFHVSIGFF